MENRLPLRRDASSRALMAGGVVADRPPIAGQQPVDGVRPGEGGGVLDGGAAHRVGPTLHQPGDRRRPVVDVVSGHQRAGDAVAHRDRQPSDRRGHHRRATGLGLDGDQAERLGIAGHRDQVGGAVHVDKLFARLRRQKRHPVRDTQFVGQPNQRVGRREAGPGWAAGHQYPQRRVAVREPGRRAQQHIGGLERLNTPDEGQDELVGVQPERRPRRPSVAGCEGLQIHAGMHHVDARRIGVVKRNQLLRFVFGVDDQSVRLVDDLLLTDRAQRRFGCVAFGKRRVLDRREGMRGVHQRHRPPITREPADLTRQPVVRVHDVVVARLVCRFGPQHAGGECAQLCGQVVLVQPFEGARDDVAHQHAGRHPHRRLIGRRCGPGEDLHLDAAARHLQRALQHVDVHAAGVTRAGLGQWRGVHRQNGDSSRQIRR